MGSSAAGTIRNDWGDDYDMYTFVLDEPRTVLVETTHELDAVAGLYDRSGQRLATAAGTGGTRIVKTLGPGTYFVRVEGRNWAEGSYSLTVETVQTSW